MALLNRLSIKIEFDKQQAVGGFFNGETTIDPQTLIFCALNFLAFMDKFSKLSRLGPIRGY